MNDKNILDGLSNVITNYVSKLSDESVNELPDKLTLIINKNQVGQKRDQKDQKKEQETQEDQKKTIKTIKNIVEKYPELILISPESSTILEEGFSSGNGLSETIIINYINNDDNEDYGVGLDLLNLCRNNAQLKKHVKPLKKKCLMNDKVWGFITDNTDDTDDTDYTDTNKELYVGLIGIDGKIYNKRCSQGSQGSQRSQGSRSSNKRIYLRETKGTIKNAQRESEKEAKAIGQILNKNGKAVALILRPTNTTTKAKEANNSSVYLTLISQRDKLDLPVYGIKEN